jgi:hypothetical protein
VRSVSSSKGSEFKLVARSVFAVLKHRVPPADIQEVATRLPGASTNCGEPRHEDLVTRSAIAVCLCQRNRIARMS